MNTTPRTLSALMGTALLAAGCASAPGSADMSRKAATPTTVGANQAMRQAVAAFDKRDFDDATRGKLAELSDPLVKAADGRIVWDTRKFDFLKGEAPATANPSLWRMQQLNHAQGLFKVADGIYQIRGYDIANMTLVEGATGWIVIDTMLTAPVSKAGLKLAMETLKSTKPVVAVIYTHSHADHFGGVRGVVDEADVRSGKVKIIAPDAFMEYAISENVLAGNAMTRRAMYMYGVGLPQRGQGTLGTGLGLALSEDPVGLIPPTQYIKKTGEK
jgi:alkyl sulfatase BDS1-like metallo-beta-lactamase superfamily hydrolase